MQRITITGKVAFEDAVIRTVNLSNGDQKQVLSFKVSTIDFGGKKVDGNYPSYIFDCTMWKRVEYLAPVINKGANITVHGTFSTNEYNSKTYLKINADDVDVTISAQPKETQQPESKPKAEPAGFDPATIPQIDVDDLEVDMPF